MDWIAVQAIATCVLAAGIGIAIWQINQAKRSTNAQVAMDLFNELRRSETIEMLRSIYELSHGITPSTLASAKYLNTVEKKEIAEKIDYILDRFDVLGALVDKGIIDDKLAIDAYAGTPALRCWYILHKYIDEVRHKRGYFVDNFEAFARLSLDYFYKAGIEVKFYREGKKKDVELVFEKLQEDGLKPRNRKKIEKDRKEGEV